jgi:hypothetical protein
MAFMNSRCARKNVDTLHVPKMQKINENPVFSQFVSVPPVNINNPHFTAYFTGGHPHEAAGMNSCEVWPAKKTTKTTLGQSANMSG